MLDLIMRYLYGANSLKPAGIESNNQFLIGNIK